MKRITRIVSASSERHLRNLWSCRCATVSVTTIRETGASRRVPDPETTENVSSMSMASVSHAVRVRPNCS